MEFIQGTGKEMAVPRKGVYAKVFLIRGYGSDGENNPEKKDGSFRFSLFRDGVAQAPEGRDDGVSIRNQMGYPPDGGNKGCMDVAIVYPIGKGDLRVIDRACRNIIPHGKGELPGDELDRIAGERIVLSFYEREFERQYPSSGFRHIGTRQPGHQVKFTYA